MNQIAKNQEYIVDIIDNGYQGEGIAKIDDYIVFIPNAISGEKVKILIVKANKSYGYGKILEFIEKSKDRIEPICATYKRCGGCNLLHMTYERQLKLKTKTVKSTLKKEVGKELDVKDTLGMKNPYAYRNKGKYALSYTKKGEKAYGFFAQRTHEIILPEKCHIQNHYTDKIAKYIFEIVNEYNLEIYNEITTKGIFRNIIIKIGVKTNEIMVVFVTTNVEIPYKKEIVNKLIAKFENIKTIVQNINDKVTNAILGDKNINLYGDGYITDILGEYKFKISPLSFYQVNPVQTEVLYKKAIEFAALTGNEIVYDLYCGIGTISLFISSFARKVYGIEIVSDAIKDAKENAKINGINNVEFTVGAVEEVLPKMYKQGIMADVVFIDPPRKGLDQTTIDTILNIKPQKIVYISCNPATLARDLKILNVKYEIKQIQPVDMFPRNLSCGVRICFRIKRKY